MMLRFGLESYHVNPKLNGLFRTPVKVREVAIEVPEKWATIQFRNCNLMLNNEKVCGERNAEALEMANGSLNAP
jgi:hypothetical protein